MSDPLKRSARPLERLGLGLLGAQLGAAAALSALLARAEMSLRGVICGVDHPAHCAWCYAAAALAAASVGALWRASRSDPRLARAPAAAPRAKIDLRD